MAEQAVKRLRGYCDVIYQPDLVERREDLESLVTDCRALIVRNRTQVNVPLLETAPHISCVGRLGVGLDNIDTAACEKRGITVYPATGANDRSVAEYVLGTAMALLRGAYSNNNRMINGEWPRSQCSGKEIFGKSLGLIGFGSIGQHTAKLATHLGMKSMAFDPFLPNDSDAWKLAERVVLSDLLTNADIVSVHVPLTDSTRHMIGEPQMRKFKQGAVIINSSRGGVVDESALVDSMRIGHLGGCALDVFEDEPLDNASGLKFASLDNIILTPHIAGVTAESNQRVSELIADKVMAHLSAM